MKKFWSALAMVLLLAPLGLSGADTMSVSQVIHLTGVVPPMRFIVLDNQNNITEITSNTPENIVPKVYLGSLQSGTELSLTSTVLKDYESKIAGKDMHSTDLHFSAPSQQLTKASSPVLLKLLNHISLLRLPLSL